MTMADNKQVNSHQPADAPAAHHDPPVPAAPVGDGDAKPQTPPVPVVVVDVMAVEHKKMKTRTTTATTTAEDDDSSTVLLAVCMWALFNAVVSACTDIATLLLNRTPCTKSTWLFRCVELTDAATAEVTALLYGRLRCGAAAALALALVALLLVVATRRGRRRRSWIRWAVDALAWVALAATAESHYKELASTHIFLAADPKDTFLFVDVVVGCVCLAADLLAGAGLLASYWLHLGGGHGKEIEEHC